MSKGTLFIDRQSKGWVHAEFNQYYIADYKAMHDCPIFCCLNRDSSYYLKAIKKYKEIKNLKRFVVRNRPKIVYLSFGKSDLLDIIFLSMFTKVEFVVHKYHINIHKKAAWKRIFSLLKLLGVKGLLQDTSVKLTLPVVIDNVNPFRNFSSKNIVVDKTFKRLIFIGQPSKDKRFESAQSYAKENRLEIVVLTDSKLLTENAKTLTFNQYQSEDGDLVWGKYSLADYEGIQSGLPFFALKYATPILVDNANSFIKFATVHPEYLIRSLQ